MNNNINLVTKDKINSYIANASVEEEIKQYLSELIAYSVDQIDDPFKNITVNQVAKDLHIGRNAAYELFKQKDFPSLNIGRKWKICYLAYLCWKLGSYKN